MRALLCIALLIAAPATARDIFVNNLEGYTVEADILAPGTCEGPAFDNPLIEEFEKGICEFHQPARSPETTARALNLLERGQTRGLPPVHQQLASLLGGLAHCAEADRHLQTYRASQNQDLLSRALMCRDRRRAQAELNAIRWNHALFEYAEGLPPEQSLNARLTEMSSCQAGVLNADFDAECGLLSALSDTEIDAFIADAVGEVVTTYFTGVESPVTAMFARKLGRAEGVLESAGAGIADIRAKAGDVNQEFEALNTAYEAARDDKMAPIYDAYREAILRATSILDEFQRWSGGLFIKQEGTNSVNLLPKIAERGVEIDEELTRVQELDFAATATALRDDIARLVDSAEGNRQTVGALCRIYFCELTAQRAMPALIRACRRPALADNPLCVGTDGAALSGVIEVDFGGQQSTGVAALCQAAGLDPAFTVLNMPPQTAATCLSQMP